MEELRVDWQLLLVVSFSCLILRAPLTVLLIEQKRRQLQPAHVIVPQQLEPRFYEKLEDQAGRPSIESF